MEWTKKKTTCPICRTYIIKKESKKIISFDKIIGSVNFDGNILYKIDNFLRNDFEQHRILQQHDKSIYVENSIFSIILYSWNTMTHMERFWENNSDGLKSPILIFILTMLINQVPKIYLFMKLFFNVRNSIVGTFIWVLFCQFIIAANFEAIKKSQSFNNITIKYNKECCILFIFQVIFSSTLNDTDIKTFLAIQFVFSSVEFYILILQKYYLMCEYYSSISKFYSKNIPKELFVSLVENFYHGDSTINPTKLGFLCRNFSLYLMRQLKLKEFLTLSFSEINILRSSSFDNYFINGIIGNVEVIENRKNETFILELCTILKSNDDKPIIFNKLLFLFLKTMTMKK